MLLIIGNGFDLSLGLKTGWKDFLLSKNFNVNIQRPQKNKLCVHLQNEYKLQTWIDVEEEIGNYAIKIDKLQNNSSDITRFTSDFKELSTSLSNYFVENYIGEKFNSWGYTKAGQLITKVKQILSLK